MVESNFRADRKVQGTELLEYITRNQKQFKFHADRAEILIKIAAHYQQLKDASHAVQALDLAVVATQAVFRNRENSIAESFDGKSKLLQWRDQTWRRIAEKYRSLKQFQKATAIERMLNQSIPSRSNP